MNNEHLFIKYLPDELTWTEVLNKRQRKIKYTGMVNNDDRYKKSLRQNEKGYEVLVHVPYNQQ